MPFSPTGVFTPAVTFVDGTTATAEDQNTQDNDIAGGLTDCMTLAGLAPATANIPMGGFKFTNVGPGSSSTDSANLGQLSALLPPGTMLPFGGQTAPTGFLLCYGQTVSQATYPALFAALGTTWGAASGGTFTLPDLRGRVLAGADNMGGSAAGNLPGYVVGSTGGEPTHTLVTGEMPTHNHTDSGHGHGVTDPTHAHSYQTVGGSGNIPGGSGIGAIPATTGSSATGISIQTGAANIQNAGGGGAHNNIQPSAGVNWMIKT